MCGNEDLKAESYDAYLQWIIARIANLQVNKLFNIHW